MQQGWGKVTRHVKMMNTRQYLDMRYEALRNDNINLLLKNVEGRTNRVAQFRTVITLVGLGPEPRIFDGIVRGEIGTSVRGSSGFGYDPVFIPKGHLRTFAEPHFRNKPADVHAPKYETHN